MTVPATEAGTEGVTPETPTTEPPKSGLTPEQEAVLKEHGITVPDDGKISVADHVKLLNALNSLKGQVKQSDADREAARLAAMSEAERKVEEARAEGRAEAEREAAAKVAKARIAAAAAAKGFNDPADAFSMIEDYSSLDAEEAVKAAVEKLAAEKPYLIKKVATPLEQGPQGGGQQAATGNANAWLRGELSR